MSDSDGGRGSAGVEAGVGADAGAETGCAEAGADVEAGAGVPAGIRTGVNPSPQTGANLPSLRSHNSALVLDLLRTAGEGGISRLELAESTGLTPQAVSKITARLRTEGLAAGVGQRASTGGKPRTVLCLVPSAAHAVGLHLDRDELTAVVVDLAGTPVAVRTAPFDLGAAAAEVVETAAGQVESVRAEAERVTETPGAASPGRLLGVGVALPGPLDHATGVLGRVTGFPRWDGFPLREALADRLGLPVVLDKDTNAAALGLALRGPGDSFAYLHLGTGLGAGLVLGGALYRGDRTGAGEFGHQVIQLDGPPCDCGNRGCIEALCMAAVARGDLAEAARVLGAGAANLVGLLDIDRVLLGGRAVATAEERFVSGVGAVLEERARGPVVPVGMADGGVHSVAEGAAQLVLAPVFGHARVFGRGRVSVGG
ncbi:ROK family transcriptional regulator [Streptomyces sp. IB2014 016-6]|uniref:ROK family transcriptional regulator n=1 Tax=Streptomyces sp. IB2014 016-6 TaxID=2517818 RepID=UPI0011CAE9A1|nr:ROK family transcriptional regulator [Streptomyces sp. IB2014 016-6]TXL88791.1 ROK family transcriptional regulator [Streptomyces sp. IB2014 016-6]